MKNTKISYDFRELSDIKCSICTNMIKMKHIHSNHKLCYACYCIQNKQAVRIVDRTIKVNGVDTKVKKRIDYKTKIGK
jgi:hypothetical protein